MLVDLWETECMQVDVEEQAKLAVPVVHHDEKQEVDSDDYYENFVKETEGELQKRDYCKT
jgi:hypothetical protein